jgi:hypothetical protein
LRCEQNFGRTPTHELVFALVCSELDADIFIVRCVFRYNNKLYRVDDIMWDMNPEATLTKFDGTTITFTQYYKQQYNKDVTDMKQPLLVRRFRLSGLCKLGVSVLAR